MTALSTDNTEFTSDQKNALQEIAKIGTGLAADTLARVLKTSIDVSSPCVEVVSSDLINAKIAEQIGKNRPVNVVQQAFFNHWLGEAIVLYEENDCHTLAPLLGYDEGRDIKTDFELLLDVSNLFSGACLNGIAQHLSISLSFCPPTVFSMSHPSDTLFDDKKLSWDCALFIGMSFTIEVSNFKAHLFIIISPESIPVLKHDVDAFLEEL